MTCSNFDTVYKDESWSTSPPNSLTISEAIQIFVEGMELADDIKKQAIDKAFNQNLKSVLHKTEFWFEKLKNSNIPVNTMFVRPESLYRFSVLIGLETDFYISEEMLKVYEDSRCYFSDISENNILIDYSYMAVSNTNTIDRDMIKADGFFFEYKTKKNKTCKS